MTRPPVGTETLPAVVPFPSAADAVEGTGDVRRDSAALAAARTMQVRPMQVRPMLSLGAVRGARGDGRLRHATRRLHPVRHLLAGEAA